MAFTGPLWSVVSNGGQLWSRISSLHELVHFKAELRDLGLVYKVIACTALWDKICQVCSKVAYSGPVFVIVSRYDRLGSYLSLYYLFRAILALSVRSDHIKIKVPGRAKVARNGPWSYNMNRYSEIWRIMAILGTGYPIPINYRQVRLKRLRMTNDAS